jgi:hypothetical protein
MRVHNRLVGKRDRLGKLALDNGPELINRAL